ncbi:MAG: AAA family ATPase, partial [Candidatus Eremiobacterota bacterium]
ASGAVARIEQAAGGLVERHVASLTQELASFFHARSNGSSGYCVYLEALTSALGDRMRQLYEQLSQHEVDELHLKQEKEQLLAQISKSDPGVFERMWRPKKSLTPAGPLLEVVERYYLNRLQIHLHREAWNIFQGLLEVLGRFRSEVSTLLEYLDRLATLFLDEHKRALGQIFSVPGEVLLSQVEVEEFLRERCRDSTIDRINTRVLEDLAVRLTELPHRLEAGRAARRMMQVTEENLGGLAGIDVLEQFFARYRGEAALDQLRLLFGRARPTAHPNLKLEGFRFTGAPEVAYVAVHGGTLGEDPARAKLGSFLTRLPEDLPVNVVPLHTRERMVFFRLVGSFPLRALDLEPLQLAYASELKQGRPTPHCREDVRWRAPARPSPRERARILEVLAMATHLGHIDAGPPNAPPPHLASPRWPDMAGMKSVLNRCQEMPEAFLVERSFLAALTKWQDERLEELGAEGFLKLLEGGGPSLEVLGRDFSDSLRRARERLLRRMQDEWPDWERVVAALLEQSPSLSEGDLVQIPSGFRRWAMQRYVDEHPADNLSFHPATARLEVVSAADLSRFDGLWRKLMDAREEGGVEEFAGQARELVDFFCHLVGFTPGQPTGLSTLWGMTVNTFGLRIKIPRTIPFVVSLQVTLAPDDMGPLRSILEQAGLDNRFALLVTPGDVGRNRRVVVEGLSSLLRYDVIVLGRDDLRDMIRSRNRLSALVARILEQVDLTVVSPFVTEGPVPSSMFFGREGEIKEILYRLDNTNVALIGPRRIGKTSVLQRVLASLRRAERPLCYLDCQALARAEDLLLSLAAEHLSDRETRHPLSFPPLLHELQNRFQGRQALIILDEIDMLLSSDPDSADMLVRAFRQATTEERARFLFCGERTLHQRLHLAESALFNFCQEMKLGFLDPRDATKLITEPMEQMEVRFSDLTRSLSRILEVTAGHPNLIQRTCSSLVDRLNEERTREISNDLLDEVLGDPAFAEEYLETLWGSSGMREKIASLVLEEGEEVTVPDLRRRLAANYDVSLSLPDLVESLDHLCLSGVLERHGTRYRFAVTSFPRIVRQTMDVPEAVELYKEMMLDGS